MEKFILIATLCPEHRSYSNDKHIQLIIEQAEGVFHCNESHLEWLVDCTGSKLLMIKSGFVGCGVDIEKASEYMEGFVNGISYD